MCLLRYIRQNLLNLKILIHHETEYYIANYSKKQPEKVRVPRPSDRVDIQTSNTLNHYKYMEEKQKSSVIGRLLFNTIKLIPNSMKLTFLFLVTTLLSFTAIASAQHISISVENAKIEEVLSTITTQTGLKVAYSKQVVNLDELVSIQANDEDVNVVLDQLFANTSLTYEIKNDKIYLFDKKSQPIASQQKTKVKGTVLDIYGDAVIGANVIERGTTNGVITDIDGGFTLDVSENATLQITYIGYISQNIPVKGQTSINIVLSEDSQSIDEVVVIGYGVQKKRDLTGAVSSVKMDDSPVGTFTTVSHALAGKAAGLQVNQSSAQVGGGATFRIRGATSTGAGNDPLIIIDGFPVSNTSNLGSGNRYDAGNVDNVLETINPNDIESIEVLKDASSTAIYGSRAGHGVIIITTKRGKNQKLQVNYSGNISVQNMKNGYKMLDGKQYMQQRNRDSYELYLKSNGLDVYKDYIELAPGHVTPEFIPKYTDQEIANVKGTDWFDQVTRTGYMQSHNLSLQGGGESTQYLASVNYTGQNGVIKNNEMERLTAKINLDQKISKYVKAGITFNISRNQYDNVPLGDKDWEDAGIINSAVRFNPTIPVYNEDGTYAINPELSQVPNPVSLLEITDKSIKDRLLSTVYLEVQPIEGLLLKAVLGADRRFAKRKNYLPKTTMYGAAVNGQASISQNDNMDYLMDLTASYTKEINNHSFAALVGYSYQEFNEEGFSAGNQDFLLDAFLYNNLGAGAFSKPSVGSWASKNALGSYFARVNYSYMGRYLLTATLRADGASNFNPDNRWGYFPSVSLGWRFSDEEFMQPFSDILSNGKLRFGYGQTGNSNVGNRIMDTYQTGYNNVFGESGYIGVYANQLGNPKLTWETTSEFNIGLDLGFFNNRISASLEYYNRTISDLLVKEKPLLSYNEITNIAANIGETQGKGFEFTLNTVNVTNKDWLWTSDLTLSVYKDKWRKRDPDWKPASYQSVKDPIRAKFSYLSDGLLQAGEKVPDHQKSLLPGQVKLKDINGDGKLDNLDMVYIGTSDPDLLLGFNNTLKYKNFDFNIYFYGEFNKLMGASYYDSWSSGTLQNAVNVSTGSLKTWRHDNANSKTPSALNSDYSWGDYYNKKISFIRCRNITAGYTLPVSKDIANRIRIYADVNNPFVITNWTGIDPETEGHNYSYPNVTSFSFGVDITF